MVTIAARSHGVDTGSLDELHFFKQSRFKSIYFCPSCIRSFESTKSEEVCKFCGGHVRLVGDMHKFVMEPVSEKKHRFYCPKCAKTYEDTKRLERCSVCSTPVIQFYEYQELDVRDKLLYKLHKMFNLGERKRVAEEKKETEPKKEAKMPSLNLPRFSFRSGEELPTK